MAEYQDFTDAVARIKYVHGISQAAIANALGIKPQYLTDMIKGRAASRNAYSRLLELYPDCFSGGADAAPPSDAQPPAAESGGDMVERIVQLLNDRDREIADLNRQIGRLEAQLEAAQKGAAHQGGNATVADVG